jgi:hypothetical protein
VSLSNWASNGLFVHSPADIQLNIEQVGNYDRGKLKNCEKTCPSATLSTTNTTWTDQDMNPGLCGEKPATDHLSCGRAN